MSFILDPFIFEQLEDFYERILTMPYTHELLITTGSIETQTIRFPYTKTLFQTTSSIETQTLHLPYTLENKTVDLSNESYKIVTVPYTRILVVASSSVKTQTLTLPYNVEFTVSGGVVPVPVNQDGYPYLSYETF